MNHGGSRWPGRLALVVTAFVAAAVATTGCAGKSATTEAGTAATASAGLSESDKAACEKVHAAFRDMKFAMSAYETAVQKNGYDKTDPNEIHTVVNAMLDYSGAIEQRLRGRTNQQLIAAMTADLQAAKANLGGELDKAINPTPSHSLMRTALANMTWQDRTGAVCGLAAQ